MNEYDAVMCNLTLNQATDEQIRDATTVVWKENKGPLSGIEFAGFIATLVHINSLPCKGE